MADLLLGVKIGATGGPQTVRQIKAIDDQVKQLQDQNKRAAETAKALSEAYDLSDAEVEQLVRKLVDLEQQTEQTAEKAGRLGQVFTGFFEGIGRQGSQLALQAFQQLGQAILSTVGNASQEFKTFEAALTQFDAKSTATAEQIGRIGDQSKELAAITSQTPTGVAQLATALLTLGATADDVETNLRGITLLADVLGEDPVLTGQVVQTGLNIFGEFGETADSLSDKLNFLVNNSAAGAQQGLSEFFQLFADVGGIVGATGAEFDDLASAFAVLRGGGASASVAATGIKTALLALSGPTSEANNELKKLGVSAFDADGNFIGLGETLEQFEAAFQSLNQQQQLEIATKIFGREGAPAFLAGVKNASGGIADLRAQLSTQADGSLAESLEVINQSLERQQILLEGQLAGAYTSLGQAIAPVELALTQFASQLLTATTEGSAGLEGLTAAGERLRVVLTQNPEVVDRLGAALATVADAGVRQLELLIDSITNFVAQQENIDLIAESIEDLAVVVTTLGQAARFVVVLTSRLVELKDRLDDFPILGEVLGLSSGPLNAVRDLIGVFDVLRDGVRNVAEFIAELVSRFDVLAQNPVIAALVGQILETEKALGGVANTIAVGLTDASQSLGQAGQAVAASLQGVGDSAEDAANRTGAAAETIEEALKRLGDANKASLGDLQVTAANARAAILEAGGDPAQLAAAEAKALSDRLAENKRFLDELKALQSESLGAEDAAALADQIRGVEQALANDRVAIAQGILKEKERTEKAAAEAKAKAETDALKKVRDEEKRAAADRQAEAERLAQREFDDARSGRTEARDAQRRAEDRAFQQEQQASDRAFQEQRRASDRAFQRQQQDEARAFQQAQQSAAEAFQRKLDAERQRGGREFDVLTSEVERRIQLQQAADAQSRRELQEQFRQEDAQLKKRRRVERQVLRERASVLGARREETRLSPLEQARQDFEEQLQAKQQAFQESQQAAAQAFAEQQAAEEESRRQAQQAEDLARAEERQQLDDDRAELRRQEDKAFAEQERALQDAFEAQQRDQRAAFNEQQRALDEASASRIAAILDAAKVVGGQSLRSGGVAEGGIVQVHKDEFLLPPKGTRVVSQRESRALVRESLSARSAAAMMGGAPSAITVKNQGLSRVEARLDKLIKTVESGRRVQPGGNIYNLSTPSPVQDAAALEVAKLRQLTRARGL